jgi:hypothetical protein
LIPDRDEKPVSDTWFCHELHHGRRILDLGGGRLDDLPSNGADVHRSLGIDLHDRA